MSITKAEPVYYELAIVAASPTTEIWLGDDDGHFVQKEIAAMKDELVDFLRKVKTNPLFRGQRKPRRNANL